VAEDLRTVDSHLMRVRGPVDRSPVDPVYDSVDLFHRIFSRKIIW
jgi:hypothetical protein